MCGLIIGRRLERLDENEKRVLAAAAVIGRSFSFQLLTAISQVDVDELFTVIEKAQQMGIIVPSSEGPERPFTFAHELVRQTLLAGISAPRRQQLHAARRRRDRATLSAMPSMSAPERSPTISSKQDRSPTGRKLVDWLTLAGKSALEAAAFEEARRSFRSALSHQAPLTRKKGLTCWRALRWPS